MYSLCTGWGETTIVLGWLVDYFNVYAVRIRCVCFRQFALMALFRALPHWNAIIQTIWHPTRSVSRAHMCEYLCMCLCCVYICVCESVCGATSCVFVCVQNGKLPHSTVKAIHEGSVSDAREFIYHSRVYTSTERDI